MKRLARGILTAAWVALTGLTAHALEIGSAAPDCGLDPGHHPTE